MLDGGRARLSAVNGAAARFFGRQLAHGWVPGYLAGRGFDIGWMWLWRLGYAPPDRTALVAHLRALGFAADEIEAAGLATRSAEGVLTGMFRDRLMFPVRAPGGTVAGFIGRAPPGARNRGPVYLNSPATSLYRKGSLLFGLHEAAPWLAAGARPVLTEGPLDAIAVTLAGYAGVAPCGTALTADQVRLLADVVPGSPASAEAAAPGPRGVPGVPVAADPAVPGPRGVPGVTVAADPVVPGPRSIPGVTVAFDADPAGRRAAVRAFDLLRAVTDDIAVAPLPAGADPAGYLRDFGPGALARVLDASGPLADLVVDARLAGFDRWLAFTDAKFLALGAVAPLVAGLPPADVARQVARVARRLGLSHAEVTAGVIDALDRLVTERHVL